MCAAENALDPFLLRDVETAPDFAVRIVSQDGHDRVGFVENDDATVKIGYGNEVTLDRNGRWHAQTGDDDIEEIAFEIVVQEATFRFVIAITD